MFPKIKATGFNFYSSLKRDVYELVLNACQTHSMLQVRIDLKDHPRQTFLVYPYKIIPDPLHTQEYLACYTRKPEEPSGEKKDASFSMARFQKPKLLKRSAFLSKNDINKIEDDISRLSITFLLGEPSDIYVKLTEQGKKLYQTRLYSRPEKIDSLSTENTYAFSCSEFQAYYYFFPFGPDAEIIQPVSLRNKMRQNYSAALENYN